MRMLLTGGAGYIGSHTAAALLQAGHEVVVYDNLSNSHPEVIQRLQQISGKSVVSVWGDVRHTELLAEVLQQQHIEAVIHFAGLKAVGESVAQPLDYYANNVQGSISLLQAMRQCNVRLLVFSSSATVYGDPQYLPIDELHPLAPMNPYGRTKLHIENILADLTGATSDWRICSLRYFNPVGAHPTGMLGESPCGVPNNLMPYVSQVAVGLRPYLQVFGSDWPTDDGTGVRDYIHVMDLARGHVAAVNFLYHNMGWYVFNLGTGVGTSVLQMLQAFAAASGKHIPYRLVARRPGDVAVCYAAVDKALQDLGWRAEESLQSMCESAWRWQRNKEMWGHPTPSL